MSRRAKNKATPKHAIAKLHSALGELVEEDVQWQERLDHSIQRLADATQNLSIGVAAHTQRLDLMEEQTKETKSTLRDLGSARELDYRTLDKRITDVQTSLVEKINEQTATLTDKMDNKVDELKVMLSAGDQRLWKRVARLEKWRTWVAGGAAVVLGTGGLFASLLGKVFIAKLWTAIISVFK